MLGSSPKRSAGCFRQKRAGWRAQGVHPVPLHRAKTDLCCPCIAPVSRSSSVCVSQASKEAVEKSWNIFLTWQWFEFL